MNTILLRALCIALSVLAGSGDVLAVDCGELRRRADELIKAGDYTGVVNEYRDHGELEACDERQQLYFRWFVGAWRARGTDPADLERLSQAALGECRCEAVFPESLLDASGREYFDRARQRCVEECTSRRGQFGGGVGIYSTQPTGEADLGVDGVSGPSAIGGGVFLLHDRALGRRVKGRVYGLLARETVTIRQEVGLTVLEERVLVDWLSLGLMVMPAVLRTTGVDVAVGAGLSLGMPLRHEYELSLNGNDRDDVGDVAVESPMVDLVGSVAISRRRYSTWTPELGFRYWLGLSDVIQLESGHGLSRNRAELYLALLHR